jgi:uncharacterized protein YbjT (DUF2867 family)
VCASASTTLKPFCRGIASPLPEATCLLENCRSIALPFTTGACWICELAPQRLNIGSIRGMKILVTGGTGFVGSHAVAALVRDGHDVRLLVRRLGTPAVADMVVGDVLDEGAVSRALDGCQAVVHTAGIFSLDARRAEEMRRTNTRATELVLNGAAERGLDPIVHVSTTVALTRYGGTSPDLPLGDIDLPYTQSKIASERVARRLQDAGTPVVTIYPGAVYGPRRPLPRRPERAAALDPARPFPDVSTWRPACRRRTRRGDADRRRTCAAGSAAPLHRARPSRGRP